LFIKGKILTTRSDESGSGLINHGATCYLNSLLQTLYNDLPFRQSIYSIVDSESPIILELQRLFASMQRSHCSAVTTDSLLVAFGWKKSNVFEQHDIHELFSVLINSLGEISTKLKEDLKVLFEGSLAGNNIYL
jgi:ubiquitin carboxyl-terminal hydrolase 7